MAVQIVSFLRRSTESSPRDWSNEELAQLYRVENALVQLNVRLETERGLSDDGDPWFVFCRADGEVLVHVARFDGFYHLHAPAVPFHLHGKSFIELTRAFVDRYPVSIPVKRGAKVVLHPAAIFTALVAAAFFATDNYAEAAIVDSAPHPLVTTSDNAAGASAGFMESSRGQHDTAVAKHNPVVSNQLSTYLNAVAAAATFMFDVISGDILGSSTTSLTNSHDVAVLLDDSHDTISKTTVDLEIVGRGKDVGHAPAYSADLTFDADSSAALGSAGIVKAPLDNISTTLVVTNEVNNQTPVQTIQVNDKGLHSSADEFSTSVSPHISAPFDSSRGASSQAHSEDNSSTLTMDLHLSTTLRTGEISATDSEHATAPSAALSAIWNRVSELINDHVISQIDGSTPTSANVALSAADANSFSAAASNVIMNFIFNNPAVKFFAFSHSIVLYDGLTTAQDSSPLVVKSWTLEDGHTISVVGHADHPLHYDWA